MRTDDGHARELRRDVVRERGIRVGTYVSDAELQAGARESELRSARGAAIRFLRTRPRSVAEVEQRLTRGGAPPDVVAETVEEMRRAGYLDDAAFAAAWVESRLRLRPKAANVIARELAEKGIDAETAESALADAMPDEEALARRLAEKRATQLPGVDRAAFYRRLGAFLARRGFGQSITGPLIDELWKKRDNQPD